jgi:DNA-binding Xre family transcriptional regulator
MKNLQTFSEFINEGKLNEEVGLSLDKIMQSDPDGKDGYLEIAKILGAKPSDIVVYDPDEDGDSKEYKKLDKEWSKGGNFKDASAPEYEDYFMSNVAYSKKLNAVSTYSGGWLSFFVKK